MTHRGDIQPYRSLENVIEDFKSRRRTHEVITTIQHIPPRDACFGTWPSSLAPALVELYRKKGIQSPYIHQSTAWGHILAGKNVVIVTPTASARRSAIMCQ